MRYVPRPIGGRSGANVYGEAFNSVHQRDLRMMKAVGVNTVIIEQPTTASVLEEFLDTANGHRMCVIVEFGLWSKFWPRAEGGYVSAYDSFRTLFYDFLSKIYNHDALLAVAPDTARSSHSFVRLLSLESTGERGALN